MKRLLFCLIVLTATISCKTTSNTSQISPANEVKVTINLNDVVDDKVQVTVFAPTISSDETVYYMPKIVPGTYSEDNYGKLIENVKAYDAKGKLLEVTSVDANSYKIANAKNLYRITYLLNDTYDQEKTMGFGNGIFSPAGTNIEKGVNFVLNNHGFVGYFQDKKDLTYKVTILHPDTLFGATSLIDNDTSATSDLFVTSRYNELVDNPIMYSKPDYVTFSVDGMEILFSVYSPSGKHSAKTLSADLETTMRAQKKFLGEVNNNKKYTVLLYLSDMKKPDARGFGALEHNTSTTVCFPDMMSTASIGEQIKDVVSHEFFHIVTPLGVHSNEIHYFDYNTPKMSKHLWMYEGVTEYFANLFQVNQGLISESEFYNRMQGKINQAKSLNDTMPFTEMSENVLKSPYKEQYLNVYEKGALIGMCIDIIIREKSNGQRGILDLMQKLTHEFGPSKPFHDAELFSKIVEFTYPEVGEFLTTHVAGSTPIKYEDYFAKMGIAKATIKKPENPFLRGTTPCITGNSATKEIMVRDVTLTNFMTSIGLKPNDAILAVNGTNYTIDSLMEFMTAAQNWKEADKVSIKVKRDGKEVLLNGKVTLTFAETKGYQLIDASKEGLKNSWLKG